jgi:hypothetical protein
MSECFQIETFVRNRVFGKDFASKLLLFVKNPVSCMAY